MARASASDAGAISIRGLSDIADATLWKAGTLDRNEALYWFKPFAEASFMHIIYLFASD